MTMDQERSERFEELDAGRVLGDLDAAEAAEWHALAAELGTAGNPSLDLLAAELEAAVLDHSAPTLPPDLAAALKHRFVAPAARPVPTAPPASPISGDPSPGKIVLGPWLGWAVAACLLALLAITQLLPNQRTGPAETNLVTRVEQAQDAIRLPLGGAGDAYANAAGEIIWSDSRQEGYMKLANLPANDPQTHQYQLWIVDPARDEFPVDGGVFDIPAGPDPVIIPIDAKLAVKNPAVFVITLEQPGGVVRSKQEVVVALAQS